MNRRSFLKAALATSSLLPFVPRHLCAEEKPSEEKLIFNSPLTHSDWMLHPNIAWGPKGMRYMLDACKSAGWSRVHYRAFDGGRALYKSKLTRMAGKWDPDSFWNPQTEADKAIFKRYYGHYTEKQRVDLLNKLEALDYSTFDPLAEAVSYGHKIGLQIHLWVTINEDDHGWGLQSDFTKKHPEFRWRKRNGTPYHSQLSFSFPEVRKYKLALLKELLKNYKIDGLFLDWIRTGDVRDNPQNDPEGVADYGYEKPNLARFKSHFKVDAHAIPNNDDRWVRLRAEPQTIFMRDVKKLLRSQKRKIPISALVGHPWHYRGEMDKIDGNLRGLLLDVPTWAREGLIDSIMAAGYYRDGGNAEQAWQALHKETEGKVDVWPFVWVSKTIPEFEQSFDLAKKLGAREILFWEADYIENVPQDVRTAMLNRSAMK